MPVSEVTLVLSDWTRGSNGKKYELPHISMNSTITEVKKSVLQALTLADEQPDSILLFIGSLHLENEKLLREYNRSNRSKLSVDVYERVDLNLRVKTLQHCGAAGCVCVPLWSFLCRQTININIPDHKTVDDLKKRIADELDDPDRYTAANIKLTFNNNMLVEDRQVLKDIGLQNDSTLTLFVDCCYWKKSRKADAEKPAEEPQAVQGAAAKQEAANENVANEEAAGQDGGPKEGEPGAPDSKALDDDGEGAAEAGDAKKE